MVHEMLHAWLHITGRETKHDSEAWYAAIRRLSPEVLGHPLEVGRGADRKSVRIRLDDRTTVVRKVANPDAARTDRWRGGRTRSGPRTTTSASRSAARATE